VKNKFRISLVCCHNPEQSGEAASTVWYCSSRCIRLGENIVNGVENLCHYSKSSNKTAATHGENAAISKLLMSVYKSTIYIYKSTLFGHPKTLTAWWLAVNERVVDDAAPRLYSTKYYGDIATRYGGGGDFSQRLIRNTMSVMSPQYFDIYNMYRHWTSFSTIKCIVPP